MSDNTPATAIQPSPTGTGAPIFELVIDDIKKRAIVGKEKYGVHLHANNGRDALVDAYQESLDLCCYLKQKLEELKNA